MRLSAKLIPKGSFFFKISEEYIVMLGVDLVLIGLGMR
jgi:hypothetical protein